MTYAGENDLVDGNHRDESRHRTEGVELSLCNLEPDVLLLKVFPNLFERADVCGQIGAEKVPVQQIAISAQRNLIVFGDSF